ncbi:hypothetical protein [Mesorhizobium sp.]|uniref:hypothetical protein n=1 Tax=Mesorhizobium sp. TaxID=1871066 RepID=UPI00121C93B0|nr:hypothetical protein [Mesorhizobium sp.]TIS89711.1 MAG: hypothetical protein E5W89_14385 [Mesorhizobium sp.]
MFGPSWKSWQQVYRPVGGAFGAIMLAVGFGLFLLLMPSGKARGDERHFDALQAVSIGEGAHSIADCKVDRAISTTTVPSGAALDESDCHVAHTNCGLCAGGHCFGCSAVVLATMPNIGFEPDPYPLAFLDQSGLALTKPNAAFRPPRSVL